MARKEDEIFKRGNAWRQNQIPNKDGAIVAVYSL